MPEVKWYKRMVLALDYDGTYTADPALWDNFIKIARERGHQIHMVTMRYESEPIMTPCNVDAVHYTGRKAKRAFLGNLGLNVDIWLDDAPEFIVCDSP